MTKIEPKLSTKMANMGIVSAFLIVAMHGYAMASMPVPGSVSWWFYKLFKENFTDIAVPYFFLAAAFFLAGHFSEQGWFWREVCKRIRSLLVPMFLWGMFALFLELAAFVSRNVLAGKPLLSGYSLNLMHIAASIGLTFDPPHPTSLWFLRALFLLVLISPMLFRGIRIFGILVPLAFMVVNYLVMPLGLFGSCADRFLCYFFSVNGLAWFSFGAWLRLKANADLLSFRSKSIMWMWLSLGVIAGVRMVWFFAGLPLRGVVDKSIIPVALLAVWSVIPVRALPHWLTAASFPVYLLHPFLFYFLYGGMAALHCKRLVATNLGVYAGSVLFVFGMSVLIPCVMKRYVPKIARILFGGRM